MKPSAKVFIAFFSLFFLIIFLPFFNHPSFAQQVSPDRIQTNPTAPQIRIQNTPAPSVNKLPDNLVVTTQDKIPSVQTSTPEASPVNPVPIPTSDRIQNTPAPSPQSSPSNMLNNQIYAPEKVIDIPVTAQIEFKNPISLDEFLALQKRLGLNKVILESDFIYKGEKIHEFYSVYSPNQNIGEDFKAKRSATLKLTDEAKQKRTSEQISPIIKTDNVNLTVTKVDNNPTNAVTDSANTDNIFVVTKVTVFDNKTKIDKIQNDFPDTKINTTQELAGSVGLNNNIHATTIQYSNPNAYKAVPVSGYSGFGELAGVGRYSFQYMTWDVNNFASNEIYEHDIFTDNSDGRSYLDSSDSGRVWGCFPNITYAATSWPQESFPYLDTRLNVDDTGIYCETKGIAYTIGAAKAAALNAKTEYWTSIWTNVGNSSTDQFTLELQVGPYKPDNYNPPDCSFPPFTPAWCTFDYKEGHVVIFPHQGGDAVSPDKTVHKWTNIVTGIWQAWKYTGVPPQAPSNVFISDTTSSTQKVHFTDNSTNEESFNLEVKIGSEDWKSYGSISENLSGYESYILNIKGISPNTQYCYRFKAVNAAGSSGWSNDPCSKASKAEVIVDERSNDFSKGGPFWDADLAYNGHIFWTYVNGNKVNSWGEWKAELTNWNYEVFAFIPKKYATTTNAKYEISYNGGTVIKSINQNNYYNEWVSLGTYSFKGAKTKRVRLTDATGEGNHKLQIGFDAIKFTPK